MLAREYQTIAAIDAPCVVDIYDYGVHDGREYLAMEYFPRGDLRRRMEQPLSVAAAVAYVQRIAAALQVVHDAGVVHRDLKPQNVMLRENDDVVLIDFGLSKDLNGTIGSTRTGVLRGSPYYMSPEQAQGLPVDRRSDLYSLGIIFHEMLLRRKPYHGETAIEILQQHVGAPLPQLPAELAGFQPILEKLLAKRPNDRYDTAAQLIDALGGGLSARPFRRVGVTPAHAPSPRYARRMGTPLSPAEAAAYLARWAEVGEREAAVMRTEPMALRLRQLCALFDARHLFPADAERDRESEIVRRRWQRLREALPVD